MEIIDYFCTEDPGHWLAQIRECSWAAGQYLYALLKNNGLKRLVGENARLLLLTEGERLISFCTLAGKDDIQPTALTPWIGWVYTFPAYRGSHCAGKLLKYAEGLAKEAGFQNIYISTIHAGLYEKYGYEFFQIMKDVEGEDSRVYVKHFNQ